VGHAADHPQGVWYAGLVIFALVADGYALRATPAAVTRRIDALNTTSIPRARRKN
jgi:hypothetical protein